MSVLIKGISKPLNCAHCLCSDESGRYCAAANEYIPKLCKPKWCPLVEVPTPHGRLVDADEVYFTMTDTIEQGRAEEAINDAPTVIEAEGEND